MTTAIQPVFNPALSTEQMAEKVKVKEQTLRKRLCQTGSYFGVVPKKLPNRLLLWPSNAVELLSAGA
jgi:hypothetical protein